MATAIRVWDLPTRVFHWTLVCFIIGLITSAQIGDGAMVWHFRFGYSVLSLLLFRIVWGLVGGRWSRFASFIYAPRTIIRYLKGQGLPEHSIGHNPLGAGSVFGLLIFLLVQVGTGLVSDDEIATSGPLSKFVSSAVAVSSTSYHKDIGKWILIGLVVLHVSAILFYYLKKGVNLAQPMIHGNKETVFPIEGSRDDAWSRALAAAVFFCCAAFVAGMVRLAG